MRDDKPAIGLDLSGSGTRSTWRGSGTRPKSRIRSPSERGRGLHRAQFGDVPIPIDEKYKGAVEGPVTVQNFETFEDGNEKVAETQAVLR